MRCLTILLGNGICYGVSFLGRNEYYLAATRLYVVLEVAMVSPLDSGFDSRCG